MIITIGVNYRLGRLIESLSGHRSTQALITLAVCVNLGLLIAFKYSNFIVNQLNALLAMAHMPIIHLEPVHLPLGISFFTFHALSYVIDVSRRVTPAAKRLDFAVYMTFFPHAIAGPIVRYGDIAAQLEHRIVTSAGFAEGVRRFILGLAKKVLIANTVAVPADAIFRLQGSQLTLGLSWLGIVCYTLQIYFDFSGYSDMAIGLARMFGIDFKENFNFPYTASSVTDFWRRWHISLSTWFRDYLYIPLGGSRRGTVRTYLNLMLVFLLCGFWHGASWTFAVWGLYHGAFLVVERASLSRWMDSLWAAARHGYTLLVIAVGWVLFRAESLGHAADFLRAMIGLGSGMGLVDHTGLYLDTQLVLAIVAGMVGSAPLSPLLARVREGALRASKGVGLRFAQLLLSIAEVAGLSLLFLVSAMHLASGTYNPFIYFRF
jgi:alginate O-acetyltransferase complex protein AlgI